MEDILREADQLAAAEDAGEIDAHHVDQVILQRAYRVDRIRELVHESIVRGVILVATAGRRIGQVNGLSVASIAKLVFGEPSRITATARLGRGEVIDIEREARLGGKLHTKAVMIVSSFIGARYALDHPPSLHATLVFEQTYGGIEGDKIEGFFDICRVQGLSGTQGVLVPESNLMLRQDVVNAVAAGTLHVYTMATVDEAMGLPFAEPGAPPVDPGEINTAVEARVRELHDIYTAATRPGGHDEQ